MKFIGAAQQIFAIVGFSSYQSTQKYPFNLKNLSILFVLFVSNISATLFLFCEASTFVDYIISIYEISTLVFGIVSFTILVLKMNDMFEFFDDFELVTQERKCKNDTNHGKYSICFPFC